MPGFCILTDSTDQFTSSFYPGQELARIILLKVKLENQVYPHGQGLCITELSTSVVDGKYPILSPPPIEHFHDTYSSLGIKHSEILTIVNAVALSKTFAHAQLALFTFADQDSHPSIDSQTTGVGLVWLVEAAGDAALKGTPIAVISRLIHDLSSKIYTLFCTQSLTYLYRSGYLNPSPAIVGEMLGLTPIFSIERGNLVLVQKNQDMHHLVDVLMEFISEFPNLKHIALIKGTIPFERKTRLLRDFIQIRFLNTRSGEHNLGITLASMFGLRCIGLILIEDGLILFEGEVEHPENEHSHCH